MGYAHLLWQVTNRTLAIYGNGTLGGLLLTRNYAQKGSLAGSVFTYKTYAILLVDQERYIVKKCPATVAYGEIIQ